MLLKWAFQIVHLYFEVSGVQDDQRTRGKGKKNVKASLSEGIEDAQQNSVFGIYSEVEMIARLKQLALDPCKPQFAWDDLQPLQNQILRLRKIMVLEDSHIPWRKRKLEQFVKDKLRAPSGFAMPKQQNRIKLQRQLSHASSVSCLLDSIASESDYKRTPFNSISASSLLTFDDTLPEKHASESSFMDNMVHRNCRSKDVALMVDSDESVNGSNSSSQEKQNPNKAPSVEINNEIHYLSSWTLDVPSRRRRDRTLLSIRLQNIIGDHLQRKAIPIGPRFQADVPEWSNTVNISILINTYNTDSHNAKWLGTRIWPIETGNMKTSGRAIGKGRPKMCCCVSPGSVDCIRRHILEKRLLLRSDLGPAFFSWKFDEMGEQVSKSWTLKEQQTFESLVQMRTSCKGKNFLKQALKCFSKKCRNDIVNYYFNVYIPRRMSVQARSSSVNQIVTDDEEEEEVNYMGMQKRSECRTLIRTFKYALQLRVNKMMVISNHFTVQAKMTITSASGKEESAELHRGLEAQFCSQGK
ncbi:UNVERIFIED_CONTAM: AT-rich interactive domain-containing protein 1 [Sesamum calycinum]|uniref:AT-rich interactive domain-containing protein 1 n=1 Tax=Sesamum calycinum TaxID=2727403 RepID=A0AAW2MZF0_9LAMI